MSQFPHTKCRNCGATLEECYSIVAAGRNSIGCCGACTHPDHLTQDDILAEAEEAKLTADTYLLDPDIGAQS